MLLDNRNFTCSISKEKEREFYDNILPEGLRFKIEFENVRGTIQEELISLFNDIISGKKSIPAQRKNVDVICELVSQFNVKDGSEINFSFNDPNIDTTRINDNNYSIQVTGRKVFEGFTNQFSNTINDIEQDKTSCTVYTSDLATAAAILKKAITDYPLLPPLKKGENNKTIKSQHREYRHLKSYNNNLEEARKKMLNEPSVIFETHHATVDDLLDFFNL